MNGRAAKRLIRWVTEAWIKNWGIAHEEVYLSGSCLPEVLGDRFADCSPDYAIVCEYHFLSLNGLPDDVVLQITRYLPYFGSSMMYVLPMYAFFMTPSSAVTPRASATPVDTLRPLSGTGITTKSLILVSSIFIVQIMNIHEPMPKPFTSNMNSLTLNDAVRSPKVDPLKDTVSPPRLQEPVLQCSLLSSMTTRLPGITSPRSMNTSPIFSNTSIGADSEAK